MKKFMWGIIALVIPSFIAVFGYQGVAQRRAVRAAFMVNGVPFTDQDWNDQMQELRRRLQEQMGENYDAAALDEGRLKEQAFNMLVNQAIIDQKIEQLGLTTTNPEVSAEIQRTQVDQRTGLFSRQAYLEALARQGWPPQYYENLIRHQLTVAKLQDLIGRSVVVTPQELAEAKEDYGTERRAAFLDFSVANYVKDATATDEELRQYYESHKERFTKLPQVQIGYVTFNAASFSAQVEAGTEELQTHYEKHSAEYIRPARARAEYLTFDAARFRDRIHPASPEVEQYYRDNQDKFRSPEKRRIRYIHASLSKEMEKIQVSPEEARTYYDTHREAFAATPEEVSARHILIRVPAEAGRQEEARALERLNMVMDEIESGSKTFAAAAAEFSADRSSAAKGGDLGSLRRGVMAKSFEQAAFAAAVGQVTGPIRTPYGYDLIQVYQHQEEVVRSFADAEKQVAEILKRNRGREAVRARMEALRAKLSSETLDPQTLGADWPVSEPPAFERLAKEIDPVIGEDVYLVVRIAFGLILPSGKLSQVVEGLRNDYLVELVEVAPSRPLGLEEAREEAERLLMDERAGLMAKEEAYAALETIRASTDGWATTRVQQATWLHETRPFGKDDYLNDLFGNAGDDFKNKVLATPQGQVGGPVEGQGASYLFFATDKQEERIPSFAEVVEEVRSAYRQEQRGEVALNAAEEISNEILRGEPRPGRLKEVAERLIPEHHYPTTYEESEPFRREEPFDPAPEFARELKTLREPGDSGYAIVREPAPSRGEEKVSNENMPIRYVVVMELEKSFPKRIPEFEEVRADVETAALAEKAAPAARGAAEKALEQIKAYLAEGKGRSASGEIDLASFALEKGYRFMNTQPFSRWSSLPELGFFSVDFSRTAAALKPGQLSGVVPLSEFVQPVWKQDEPGGMGSPLEWPTTPKSFVIMYSLGTTEGPNKLEGEQLEALKNRLLTQKRTAVFQEWLRTQNEAADVVVRMRELVDVTKDRKNVKVDLYRDQRKEEKAA